MDISDNPENRKSPMPNPWERKYFFTPIIKNCRESFGFRGSFVLSPEEIDQSHHEDHTYDHRQNIGHIGSHPFGDL